MDTSEIFKNHELQKKREYLHRVIEVEHGTFTPLILGTNGGVGKECKLFLKNLADRLAKKDDEKYGTIMTYLRTKLSFEVVKSALLCVRGSRTPFSSGEQEFLGDFGLNTMEAQIQI